MSRVFVKKKKTFSQKITFSITKGKKRKEEKYYYPQEVQKLYTKNPHTSSMCVDFLESKYYLIVIKFLKQSQKYFLRDLGFLKSSEVPSSYEPVLLHSF